MGGKRWKIIPGKNLQSQVGTENINPHSAPGWIRTGVPEVEGKTPLHQPDQYGNLSLCVPSLNPFRPEPCMWIGFSVPT